VGPKSAQRMALHILERNRQAALDLAEILQEAVARVGKCRYCQILNEEQVCAICQNQNRDQSLICVVETPADVIALEQTGNYRGRYFVLGGHLSPIDGIGPQDLAFTEFEQLLQELNPTEVILATSTTVEGETTAYSAAQISQKHQIKSSRIGLGVPMGGELEYLDGITLSRALTQRSEVLVEN